MVQIFQSVLPNGKFINGYPIGELDGTKDAKLINPEKVIVSLPKIFIFFTSNDQEDGMLSLKKEAGFTIVAKDKNIGVTVLDVIEQVPPIVKLMLENPEVFNARSWCKYDNLVIRDIWLSGIGHFEMFISE
jgi:hypothetical protein